MLHMQLAIFNLMSDDITTMLFNIGCKQWNKFLPHVLATYICHLHDNLLFATRSTYSLHHYSNTVTV